MKRFRTYIFALIGITLLLAYIVMLSNKMITGGRWSTGMLLGGVDCWLSGGTFYTVASEGLTIGSLYSPAGVFVALLARMMFGYGAETAIILFAGLIGLFAFGGFSALLYKDRGKRYLYWCVGLSLFLIGFPSARPYLFELHPDIPALMCFAWGVWMIHRYLQTYSRWQWGVATVLFLCSGLFKANALFLYGGLFLFTVFTKELCKKDKLYIILSEAVAGVGVLVTMLLMDGCWYNCVTMMGMHEFNYGGFFVQCWVVVKKNVPYLFFLFVFVILFLRKKIAFRSIPEKIWAYSSVLYFLFGMFGSLKEGSNSGNVEASLIALMPFVLRSVEYLVEYIRSKVALSGLYSKIIGNKRFVTTCVTVGCCLLVVVCVGKSLQYIKATVQNVQEWKHVQEEKSEFVRWLNAHYEGKNVAIHATFYELFNGSRVNKKTDLHIAGHYHRGNMMTDEMIREICANEHWDLIVSVRGVDEKKWPHTLALFRELKTDEYPVLSTHGNLGVYERKN